MKEDEVYVGTKAWFNAKGFLALAGQPPNGCDNIPTIEIKDASNLDKGSKGSFKPDLLFGNSKYLIIVECKPLDDKKDEIKLLEVLTNNHRKKLLFEEISQRGIFQRRKLEKYFTDFQQFSSKLKACLSHGGKPRLMEKIMTLSLSSISGLGDLTQPLNNDYKIDF